MCLQDIAGQIDACWMDPHPSWAWQPCKPDMCTPKMYTPSRPIFPCVLKLFTGVKINNARNTCGSLHDKMSNWYISLWCALFVALFLYLRSVGL